MSRADSSLLRPRARRSSPSTSSPSAAGSACARSASTRAAGCSRRPQLRGRTGPLRARSPGPAGPGQRAVRAGVHAGRDRGAARTGCPPTAGAEELALHRALLTPWVPEQVEELAVDELERRAGRALTPSDLEALEGLGVIERLDRDASGCTARDARRGAGGARRPACPPRSGGAPTRSSSGTPPRWPRTSWRCSRTRCCSPTATAADPPRSAPGSPRAADQLKPITVRGVVTAFGRAVNRTIRDRLG